MWSGGSLEYVRLRVSLCGTREAAADWGDAYAKVLQERQFQRGVACPCSFYARERGSTVVVHGDAFLSGRPQAPVGADEQQHEQAL